MMSGFAAPLSRLRRSVFVIAMACTACSPRHLIVQGLAAELASQGQAPEDDLSLARDASAFYLKLSESLLREMPGHLALAETVSGGFTQYAYAFVQFEAEKIEAKDARAAYRLRERAAALYRRANVHAMTALEQRTPGFAKALSNTHTGQWPKLTSDQIGTAYWAAASWGGFIAMSKDNPDVVADLPLAIRLADLAYQQNPGFDGGSLASLRGTFEASRPGGSPQLAERFFDEAIRRAAGINAGPLVAKAESIALASGDRSSFESLLRQALDICRNHSGLQNSVMRERALWLLESTDDLF